MAIIKRFSTKKKYKVIYLNEHNNKSAEFEVVGLANIYDLTRKDLDFQPTLVTVVDIETQDEAIFYVSMDFRKAQYHNDYK
jgi:hypothetical protein